METGQQLLGV